MILTSNEVSMVLKAIGSVAKTEKRTMRSNGSAFNFLIKSLPNLHCSL
jgi:hypothetical protein